MSYELHYYQSGDKRPFLDWLEALRDRKTRARIQTRIDRLALGNFGNHRVLHGGIYELRIDWGPGYRVYFARIGNRLLLLLCGGDKTTQRAQKKPKAPSAPYEPWLIERLKDPAEAAVYLEAAIEEGDQGVLMLALRHVAQAQGGVARIARKSRLTREATYRMLSKGGNPELKSLTALLGAAGLRLSVKPLESQTEKAA